MPYIKQELRDQLDPAIERLCIAMVKTTVDGKHVMPSAGMFNYTISKFLRMMKPFNSYTEINEVMGILECVKQEWYRRVAAPYEDEKITENGDVYT